MKNGFYILKTSISCENSMNTLFIHPYIADIVRWAREKASLSNDNPLG